MNTAFLMIDPILIAKKFNDCINSHDINELSDLMTDDHTFIDSDGNIHKPKTFMIKAWNSFFKTYPDYKNHFEILNFKNERVIITGYAYWSKENPKDDVIWTAKILNDKVLEWRVYKDNIENRKLLKI